LLPPANATLDPFIASIRSVESKLVPAQQQVITMAKVAAKKITEAKKAVASTSKHKVQGSNEIDKIFSKMQNCFEETASMNDYSLLGWPRLPDISNNAAMIKLRSKFCDDKDRNFAISENMQLKKRNELQELQDALNATQPKVASAIKKVQATSQAVSNVLLAASNVAKSQVNYGSKLNTARSETSALKDSVLVTTTTTPTTTTTFTQPLVCGNNLIIV
jgi:uncharacterized protein YoxC